MACSCCDCNHGEEEKIKVYFCPSCKSTNVKYIFELKNAFGILPKMRCLDCKTEMPSFPILITTKKEIEKMSTKRINKNIKKVTNKNRGNKK